MMAITHLFQDFSPPQPEQSPLTLLSDVAIEDQRLAAFEQGYAAGWEDAVSAQNVETTAHISNLNASLADLSFTYQEAFTAFQNVVSPVIEGLVQQVLPRLAQETFGSVLVERCLEMASQQAASQVLLVVPPDQEQTVRAAVSADLSLPLEVVSDEMMAPLSAEIRFPEKTAELDMGAILEGLSIATQSFSHHVSEEVKNG